MNSDTGITRADLQEINKTLTAALTLLAQAMTDVLILENKLKPSPDFNNRVSDLDGSK